MVFFSAIKVMLSHVRNGEAGRLRDVHALSNEELVSYGLAHHIVIADKRNELATELAGRELLRNAHPDVEIVNTIVLKSRGIRSI